MAGGEAVALADSFLTGHKVALALSKLIAEAGTPTSITVCNGSEFYGRAMEAWTYPYRIQLHFIRPVENSYIKSFNGRHSDERLNLEVFFALSDVRDKLTWLAAYHTTVRGLIEHAAATCTVEQGIAVPNTLITNVAKYHFAHNYHQAVQIVQDIAGGLLVTAPAGEDLTSEATREYVLRYLGGRKGFGAEQRLRLINLIGDLTASDFGGYQEVLAVHAEGGFEAEKLQAYREYDFKTPAAYARSIAGI